MADETATTEAPEDQAPEQETDELHQGLLDRMTEGLGDAIVGSHIAPGHALWVRVRREAWREAARFVRDKLDCTFFDFLSGIDWMPSPWGRYEDAAGVDDPIPVPDPDAPIETGYAGGDTRFQVFCRLAKVRRPPHHAVILKADVPEDDLRIDSLVPLYGGANWHERECWEMFGITFEGHPALRHLYLPAEFEGHPLRKDFPLLARLVKPWPGIVDVEPMPEEAGANGGGDGDGGGDTEGGDA
ncbi:MAG TPA: NADH-quinone oxidoreductase subunit C [Acidimicrobiales bacterium]